MNAIKTEKLTKYYGKNRGIIDVDLTVPEGDFFGFIGPNGAGKAR
jgi:ABC-2 type transport system ATP-binding protein